MQVSVIIPTLNEAENIKKLVPYLLNCPTATVREVIVVDAGSQDDTLNIVYRPEKPLQELIARKVVFYILQDSERSVATTTKKQTWYYEYFRKQNIGQLSSAH